ncbi:MAG: flagellar basal body L-ring protein FlgH [Acidobacteriota bacterium]|jgi:flagellar L-ring protein precursor FlgH|nr:flagellar basal body L-ring protein FlgH [Acidobacteriota bacterium]
MRYTAAGLVLLLVVLLTCSGCGPTSAKAKDPTDIGAYVENAKKLEAETQRNEGSLWTSNAYRSNLFRDSKARYINDIVTIRVLETTQAVASADAKNSKETSASSGFDNLFGLEKAIKELPTTVSGKGSSSFEGTGSTSRSTTLETNLAARVIDVLPNGYLVVEGKREVHVNNENQSVYLTGVVRPEDITANNIVASSAIAQMSVRLQGKGIVSQPIKPGWLYKILNGILPF